MSATQGREDAHLHYFKRHMLGSRRPLEVEVQHPTGKAMLCLHRPVYWFFSEMAVQDPVGPPVGFVRRRFAFLWKRYDLCDANGKVFDMISSPPWRIWKFPIRDPASGEEVGAISKKWSGLLKEMFTDADSFGVNYGLKPWTAAQRAIIFAAALSIDLEFFENNDR